MKVLATGPSGPAHELDALAAAGHTVTIGRPLDMPARRAYTQGELTAEAREADVILASHLETISARVMEGAERLRLAIVPFIGTDSYPGSIAEIRDRGDLTEAQKRKILADNTRRLYNF